MLFQALLLMLATTTPARPVPCSQADLALQVLGSGGPEMSDQRASSGYLIWHSGRARILIDMGPGSMLRYEHSGAQLDDLQVILLTHLHVDHSADLPALIKAMYFSDRSIDLPIYGPTGNDRMPGTEDFVAALFNPETGAYRYLASYLTGTDSYRLLARDVAANGKKPTIAIDDQRFKLAAVPVHHGPLPALAWRIEIAGRSIVVSGDMNGDNHTLETLAENADLLVAHNAVPEHASGAARELHMPPSVIGKIAAKAKVKSLVLSHRMLRTLGREDSSQRTIRKHYAGPLVFAEDSQCFPLP